MFADDLAQGRLVQLVPDWQASPLPVYLTYPHARSYPAKLRRFLLEPMQTPRPSKAALRKGIEAVGALMRGLIGRRNASPLWECVSRMSVRQ